MRRQGQGISINVVIIAAIALLILVILSVLAIRTGGLLNRGTSCEALQGTCTAQGTYVGAKCNTDAGDYYDSSGICPKDYADDTQYCCRKL